MKHDLTRTVFALLAAAVVGCSSAPRRVSDGTLSESFQDFDYCSVRIVRQSTRASCGAACLAALLSYWDRPTSEAQILLKSPPAKGGPGHAYGYFLTDLKQVAVSHGLKAFAVTFEEEPLTQLRSELTSGRPVIIALSTRLYGPPLNSRSFFRRVGRFALRHTVPHEQNYLLDHYVLLIGMTSRADRVLAMDPASGYISVTAKHLKTVWSRNRFAALLCSE